MVYFVEDDDEKKAIREIRNDLLRDAAKAARRAVLNRLHKKEHTNPVEEKAASLALDTLARIFG